MAISRDNHWLVTGGEDRTARLWDLTAKDPAANPVFLSDREGLEITAVAISPDDHWLVTGGYGKVRLWDLTAKNPAANSTVLQEHQNRVAAVAISQDNRWVVSGDHYDGTVRFFSLG
jgi:WD40 repeat protein